MAMMQDPMVMGMIGQSPMAQQMMGAIMAHNAQHLAFLYRQKVEEQLGVPLTAPDAELDEQTEVQLSRLVAQASTQLMKVNQANAQQQQAQQMAQNPEVQMKQAELQLKAEELKRKEADSQRDFQIAQGKLQIEQARLAMEAQRNQGEDPRLKALRAQQDLSHKEQIHQQKMRQQIQAGQIKAMQQANKAVKPKQ
jgi:hypothetical protein